jgi:di/tricarboxylate transporter
MKEFTPRKALMPFLFRALLPCFFGFMALSNNLGKDRVAALHGADIVGLMASGFCVGVTFATLMTWFMTRKEGRAAE